MFNPFSSSSSQKNNDVKSQSKNWFRYQQHFGDIYAKEVKEEDVISSLEFSQNGDYVAVGDGGGRVVLLERNINQKDQQPPEYHVFTEFQSHQANFDTLKSEDISQQIKQIKWGPQIGNNLFLLSTNAKTIKLWKVYKKTIHDWDESGFKSRGASNSLQLPKPRMRKSMLTHQPKKIFNNQHEFTINSISLNSDQETFISVDDLRINLWYLDHSEASVPIVDIKPAEMNELTEVITSAAFHPTECHTFLYTTTSGSIRCCDLRESLACKGTPKEFLTRGSEGSGHSVFNETIAAVSDAKFSSNGRFIVSRDYMTVKVWDVKMERKPLAVFNVHDSLRSKLRLLYDNDCIFDKFDCNFSGNSRYVLTGGYKNSFNVFDVAGKQSFTVEASRKLKQEKELTFSNQDFFRKCTRTAWHPTENCIAIAAVSSLYIYNATPHLPM